MKTKNKPDPRLKRNYYGYLGSSDFFQMNYEKFNKMCKGELILAIGEGNFPHKFTIIQNMTMAFGAYHQDIPKKS
jgi:hypothetical protein